MSRSSSPTALLWWHQLKKEHAYLLERLKNAEGRFERIEGNASAAAEAAAFKLVNEQLRTVEQRLRNLGEAELRLFNRLEQLEGKISKQKADVEAQVSNLHKTIAGLQGTMTGLQRQLLPFQEDRKEVCYSDKAVVSRINDVESQQREMNETIRKLAQRDDGPTMEAVKTQVEELLSSRFEQDDQTDSQHNPITIIRETLRDMTTTDRALRNSIELLNATLHPPERSILSALENRDEAATPAISACRAQLMDDEEQKPKEIVDPNRGQEPENKLGADSTEVAQEHQTLSTAVDSLDDKEFGGSVADTKFSINAFHSGRLTEYNLRPRLASATRAQQSLAAASKVCVQSSVKISAKMQPSSPTTPVAAVAKPGSRKKARVERSEEQITMPRSTSSICLPNKKRTSRK